MKVNYHKRTMTHGHINGMACLYIRYGDTTVEANLREGQSKWIDVPTGYEELSHGGKRPEDKSKKHFFNQREKDIQSDCDEAGFRAHNAERRAEDSRFTKAVEGSLGGDHRRGRVT